MASEYPLLTIDKLPDVVDILDRRGFDQEKWHELGLTLGLHKDTLDTIKRDKDTTDDCLTECLSKWLSRASTVDSKGGATFDSLSDALQSMYENAAIDESIIVHSFPFSVEKQLSVSEDESSEDESMEYKCVPEYECDVPDFLSNTPEEGLDPMPVTPEVISIAEKMKKAAENKLKTSFTIYTPLYYIKKGETDYCIRVKVDDDQLIDVCGQYCAGSTRRVKAKHVTEDDDQTFF